MDAFDRKAMSILWDRREQDPSLWKDFTVGGETLNFDQQVLTDWGRKLRNQLARQMRTKVMCSPNMIAEIERLGLEGNPGKIIEGLLKYPYLREM